VCFPDDPGNHLYYSLDKKGEVSMDLERIKSLLIIVTFSLSPFFILPLETTGEVTPVDIPVIPSDGFFRGILPNPHPGQTFDEVYENVSLHSQFVPVWGKPSPFYNLSTDLEGSWGDIFVKDLIRGNGMFPLIHMSFFAENMTLQTPPELPDATLSDPDWRRLYIDSAKAIINASRPRFFSLGNEVNRWYEHHGYSGDNGFNHFVSLYNETYDAVKSLSPETEVFCVFSREIVSQNRKANMSVLELFDPDRLDLVMLTTYPHSVQGINKVGDIPNDYYSSVFNHTDEKKIGFSEAAWPSIPHFGGEDGQSAFIENITGRLTEGLNLDFLGWPWLHDIGPTDATGLRYNDGFPKSALKTWKNNTEPTYDRMNRTIELEEDFGSFRYDLNNTFSDPGDSLTYSIWNGSDYANFTEREELNASIDGNFLVLESYDNQSGIIQVRIRAEDRMKDSNWTFFQITVNQVNDPPMLNMDRLEIYEDINTTVAVSQVIVDAEDNPILLDVSILSSPILKVELDYTSTLVFYITPPPDFNGDSEVTFTVMDRDGVEVNLTLNVTVIPVEDLPEIEAPDELEMDEDSTIEVNTTGWFSDRDQEDELTVIITTSQPEDLRIDQKTDSFNITSLNDWHGEATIYLNVSDGRKNIIETVDLLVRSVNDPPEFTKPDRLEMTEDTDLYYNLDNISPFDREYETIIYTFERSSIEIRSVIFPANGTIRVSPALNAFGDGNFTISMRDPSGGITFVEFEVNITPVNDPPYLFTPSNWTIHLEPGETEYLDISTYPYVSEDVDDDIEGVILISDSDWCKGNSSWLEITVPADTTMEKLLITFRLSDGRGGLSEERNLTVNVIFDEIPINPEIDEVDIAVERGSITASVQGNPGIVLYLVIEDSSKIRTSHELVEDPNSKGRYYFRLEEPDLKDGEAFTAWISLERDGENSTNTGRIDLTYDAVSTEVEDEDNLNPLIPVLGIAGLGLIAIIFIFILTRKREYHEE
jgi:hypothetical protein